MDPSNPKPPSLMDALEIPTLMGPVATPHLLVAAMDGGTPVSVAQEAWVKLWPDSFHPLTSTMALVTLNEQARAFRAALERDLRHDHPN